MPPASFTLVSWINAVAYAQPERPAIVSGARTLTYRDLWEGAGRLAYALLGRQAVQPGSRVALLGWNDPDILVAYLGVLRSGNVAVPLNHLLGPRDLARHLAFADVACCLVGSVDSSAREAAAEVATVRAITDLDAAMTARLPEVTPESPAMILLTSGTTGSPKGVVHAHGTLLHAALQIAIAFPFSADDVTLAFLPFFASIPEHVLPALVSGACIDVLPRFDPEAVLAACERATSFDAVPTLMARLLDEQDPSPLNNLRWIMFASEPMPPALLERWWNTVPNVDTYELYGMTEMLTITHATPSILKGEPACVGRAFATSRVATVDEAGRMLPYGMEGEIACASPARMDGYFRSPEATNAALGMSGAMRTGDLGRFDEAGRLHLTGRIKDLIISGGLNIAPAEIEAVACRHPAVAAASVIGIPDVRWGETPVVVAATKRNGGLNARDLLAFCRSELATFKRPAAAAVVDELPTAGIGKSAKVELREAVLRGEIELVRADEVELEQR